jgi:hypothetical protein
MKFRYKEIRIRMQSGASEVAKRVPEWEVPVIQAIHPEITEIRDTCHEMAGPVSVSREYDRLREAYGAERAEGGTKGIPYVEAVYGQHAAGHNALKQAMLTARLPESTEITPEDASPELRQDVLAAISESADTADLIGQDEDVGTFAAAQVEAGGDSLIA